ncbi:uncharacterized protein [Typha angustifolia]|uniref:uncharacterized protein n=1 Tax=Typha angustifolia TaxID=59011 RepID=UPI003C2D9331
MAGTPDHHTVVVVNLKQALCHEISQEGPEAMELEHEESRLAIVEIGARSMVGWVDAVAVSRYVVHLVITGRKARTWLWIALYASNNPQAQCELWEELASLRGIDVPWIIGGDFNAYTSVQEKKSEGGVELGPKCKAFKAFVENTGLCDLGYVGIPFTWCNNQVGANRIWVKLDWMLANARWMGDHSHCTVFHLDRSASDHAPLLLTVQINPERAPRPFRFELICERIMEMEGRDVESPLGEEDLAVMRSLYNQKAALSRQLNLKWLQRSRLRWVEEGDRNTKYFQLSATIRRQRSRIPSMFDTNGNWVQEMEGVGRLFSDFYQTMWGSEAVTSPSKDVWPELPQLSREDAQQLEATVSQEEIKAALWSLPRGKAPGPDGLQAEVYIQFWDDMGESLMKAVNHFFTYSSLPNSWG